MNAFKALNLLAFVAMAYAQVPLGYHFGQQIADRAILPYGYGNPLTDLLYGKKYITGGDCCQCCQTDLFGKYAYGACDNCQCCKIINGQCVCGGCGLNNILNAVPFNPIARIFGGADVCDCRCCPQCKTYGGLGKCDCSCCGLTGGVSGCCCNGCHNVDIAYPIVNPLAHLYGIKALVGGVCSECCTGIDCLTGDCDCKCCEKCGCQGPCCKNCQGCAARLFNPYLRGFARYNVPYLL